MSENLPNNDDALGISMVSELYNQKFQKEKLKISEAKELELSALRSRHQRMLKAFVIARKALREVCKVDLGEDFSFSVSSDDWRAWPRLTLEIMSKHEVLQELPRLRIHANDSKSLGELIFSIEPEGSERRLSFTSEHSLDQAPAFLRACLREYLDVATEFVLAASRDKDAKNAAQAVEPEENSVTIEVDRQQETLQTVESFVEEGHEPMSFIDTYETQELESLPDLSGLSFVESEDEVD